jgi:hypothetical protein
MDSNTLDEILDEIDGMTREEYLDFLKKAQKLPDFPWEYYSVKDDNPH